MIITEVLPQDLFPTSSPTFNNLVLTGASITSSNQISIESNSNTGQLDLNADGTIDMGTGALTIASGNLTLSNGGVFSTGTSGFNSTTGRFGTSGSSISLFVNSGLANVALNFLSTGTNGLLTWNGDTEQFVFGNDIYMGLNEIYFRNNSDSYISSRANDSIWTTTPARVVHDSPLTEIRGELDVDGIVWCDYVQTNNGAFGTSSIVLYGESATEVVVRPYYSSVVDQAGSNKYKLLLTGQPSGSGDYEIEFTTGGTVETAIFQWRVDAGAWTTGVTTERGYLLLSNNVYIGWRDSGSDIFVTGDTYSFTADSNPANVFTVDTLTPMVTISNLMIGTGSGSIEIGDTFISTDSPLTFRGANNSWIFDANIDGSNDDVLFQFTGTSGTGRLTYDSVEDEFLFDKNVNATSVNDVYIQTVATGNYSVGSSDTMQSTGNGNSALGHQALRGGGALDSAYNVGIGYQAGYSIDSGDYNILMGYQAGYNVTDEDYNIFIGPQSGYGTVAGVTGDKNVGVGAFSLRGLTSGYQNFGFGYNCMRSVTDGFQNVGIGESALYENTTGDDNIAIGAQSLRWNNTGTRNIAIGTKAGGFNKGSANAIYNDVCIGYNSGYNLNTGNNNVLLGYYTGYSCTTGDANIFIGFNSGYRQTTLSNLLIIDNQQRASAAVEATNSILYGVMDATRTNQTLAINAHASGITWNDVYIQTVADGNYSFGDVACMDAITTGDYNSVFGYQAGTSLTEGSYNILMGYQAGYDLTDGEYNVCIGKESMANNVTGIQNICIGAEAGEGQSGNSYSYNTFLGYRSGYRITTGGSNFCMGYQAGYYNETGSFNIILGRDAALGVAGNSFDNNIYIGYQSAFSITTADNNVFLGHQSGRLITSGSDNVFLGYRCGYNQTTNSNLLIIDNQLRASAAVEATNSILYGVMAATPASQTLAINAATTISQTLDVTGVTTLSGLRLSIVAKTANYTATINDDIITCGAGNETFTITLPAVAAANTGKVYHIKNEGTGTITIDGNGAETIDGVASQLLSAQYDCVSVVSDGTEWWII